MKTFDLKPINLPAPKLAKITQLATKFVTRMASDKVEAAKKRGEKEPTAPKIDAFQPFWQIKTDAGRVNFYEVCEFAGLTAEDVEAVRQTKHKFIVLGCAARATADKAKSLKALGF